jgi:hypothetical protein
MPVPVRGKAKDDFDIRDLDDIPESDEEDPEPQGWSGKGEEQEDEPESEEEQDAGPPSLDNVLADISDELTKILRISDPKAMKRAIQGLQKEIRDVAL